jgi:hypothetical protein
MEGTPLTAGDYTLRITVDVYAVVIPGFPPIKVATATDSTSLTLVVIDNSGINDHENASFYIRHNIPNPFRSVTRIDYYSEKAGPVTFEVYNLFGARLHVEQLMAGRGENSFVYSGQALPEGAYYYVLRAGSIQSNGIMVRAE